jgi:hypothetical protein
METVTVTDGRTMQRQISPVRYVLASSVTVRSARRQKTTGSFERPHRPVIPDASRVRRPNRGKVPTALVRAIWRDDRTPPVNRLGGQQHDGCKPKEHM